MRKKFTLTGLFNKVIILMFSVLISLLAVVGSTAAWVTSTDTRINNLEGDGHFETILTESFLPDMKWMPGTSTKKEVRIYNAGTIAAFVRISIKEILTAYETETGQGGSGNTTAVESGVYEAWLYDDSGVYADSQLYGVSHDEDAIDRTTVFLNFICLKFGAVITPGQMPPANPYWLYDDGYFYYSEAVAPKSYTDCFLKSVFISPDAPNGLQNSQYIIDISHESVQADISLLSVWDISSGPVYDMLGS